MIIDQLPEVSAVQETDEIPVERGKTTYKSTLQKLKDLVASLLTKSDVGLGNVDNVRQYSAENPPIITLTVGAFSSLPQTISNSKITADMAVLSCVFGTPSAITSDITWTTSAGQLRLTGSMSGSTTAVITLGRTTY